MKNWEIALNKFLEKIQKKNDIIGILVCGSFITGNPTKHSDIDVNLILSDKSNYKERGNQIIDGYLIEYFMNPKSEIIKYFKSDFKNSRTVSCTMFLTGKILYDKENKVKELQKEAKKYFQKKLKKPNKSLLEIQKYSLWDMLDNIQNAYEENMPDFIFSYHNALRELFEKYLKYLGLPITHYYKFYAYLTDTKSRDKYLQEEFPDKIFSKLFVKATLEEDKKGMLDCYEKLTKHIFSNMNGFEIDGWKIRSRLKK